MIRRLWALTAVVGAAALIAGAPTGAQARTTIGIADQKAEMFADARFLELGVRYARLSVPWDALRYDFARRDVDMWLQAARSRGVRPLVTFQRSRVRPRSRPSVTRYLSEFRRFRRAYPWVREYAAWNEPNLEDARRPKLIARYYRAVRANCPGCTVLGGDLVDLHNVNAWVRRFLRYAGPRKPKYWGLHNYVSANRFSTRQTRALLRTIKGSKLWLTESGGLVARRNRSPIKLRQGEAHAAKVTKFILRHYTRDSRIPRVYFYHWLSSSPTDTWDSAFIGPDGTERPSLGVLRAYLGR